LTDKRLKLGFFIFPIIFLLLACVVYFINPLFYFGLFGVLESGLFEWVQFASYLLASILGFKTFLLLKKGSLRFQSYGIFVFSLLCAFIALEEISYGQHIFHWQTPDYFSSINLQGETNLHNLSTIQGNKLQEIAFVLVGAYGSFAWILRRNIMPLSFADFVFPEWFLTLYFLPVTVFYFQKIYLFRWGNNHQELFETILSFGFFVVSFVNYSKACKQRRLL